MFESDNQVDLKSVSMARQRGQQFFSVSQRFDFYLHESCRMYWPINSTLLQCSPWQRQLCGRRPWAGQDCPGPSWFCAVSSSKAGWSSPVSLRVRSSWHIRYVFTITCIENALNVVRLAINDSSSSFPGKTSVTKPDPFCSAGSSCCCAYTVAPLTTFAKSLFPTSLSSYAGAIHAVVAACRHLWWCHFGDVTSSACLVQVSGMACCRWVHLAMGVGRIFSRGGPIVEFFRGGAKIAKLNFTHSKLGKQPFFGKTSTGKCQISKSRWDQCPPLPPPNSDALHLA